MKAITPIYVERDMVVLPRLVRQAMLVSSYPIRMPDIYLMAAELPVDKFYIGDYAACEYMRKRFLHKKIPKFVSPYKKRLFDALYDEVIRMMHMEKYKGMGLKNLTLLALDHKAPCVGLTPTIIGRRFSKVRKRRKLNE